MPTPRHILIDAAWRATVNLQATCTDPGQNHLLALALRALEAAASLMFHDGPYPAALPPPEHITDNPTQDTDAQPCANCSPPD